MAPRRLYAILLVFGVGMLTLASSATFAGDKTPVSEMSAREILSAALSGFEDVVEPPDGAEPRTLVATMKVVQADGLPPAATGAVIHVAFQAPDHLKIAATVDGNDYSAGRDGNELWVDEPSKQFAVLGKPGMMRFHGDPDSVDRTELPPFALPVSRRKLAMASWVLNVDLLRPQKYGEIPCVLLHIAPRAAAAELFHFTAGDVEVWLRQSDLLPARVVYVNDKVRVQVDVTEAKFVAPWEADAWKLHPADVDAVETVAVSHLYHALKVAAGAVKKSEEPLPKINGKHTIIAREGKGRLEMVDGNRIVFLKGSPQEMGRQHGVLLNKEIRSVADHILYGVGVGSSFVRGSWFFAEIESAESRLEQFMDERYLAEEDAMARAAG